MVGAVATCRYTEPAARRALNTSRALLRWLLVALFSATTTAAIPIDDADVLASLSSCSSHVEVGPKHLFRVGSTALPVEGSSFCGSRSDQCCYAFAYQLEGSTLPCAELFIDGAGFQISKPNAPGFAYEGNPGEETRLKGYESEVYRRSGGHRVAEQFAPALPVGCVYKTVPPRLLRLLRCRAVPAPALVEMPAGYQPERRPGYASESGVQKWETPSGLDYKQQILVGRPAAGLIMFGGASNAMLGKLGSPRFEADGAYYYEVEAQVRDTALAAEVRTTARRPRTPSSTTRATRPT